MSEDRRSVLESSGFGRDSTVTDLPICSSYAAGIRCKRPMHQSTLILGDQTKPIYSTTHTESFSRRACDDQELVFPSRHLNHTSQHDGQLDLSNISVTPAQTHNREVHGPKGVEPHHVLHSVGIQNGTRSREGLVMKEVINPPGSTLYQSSYHTEHCSTSSTYQTNKSSGHPVPWHTHDVLTGEEKDSAGPAQPRRRSGEQILWAARRWESHCDSFRLY